jgi:2-keto-4-pentenoate hydratase/2-oxohepta-3-ene-1,7-dioic acid hydratase in catechol pathway
MRLASFSINGKRSYGIVSSDGGDIVDLTGRIDGISSLQDLVTSGRMAEAHTLAEGGHEPDYQVNDVTFEIPLAHPPKIFCIGVNYGGRNAEYKDGQDDKAKPSVFVRFPSSFTGHEQTLVRPPESEQLDYEGEIVAVIGKGGRRIRESEARDHVAGLTLGNEGTIRDWVRHAKFNVTQGKNWDGSGAIGPWLVTMDEIPEFDRLHLTTRVNGELRQDDTPATMAYPIEFQIAYLSTFTTLEPGDIIFTGTPTGAGARMEPPQWLTPGDVVEVNVPEIGTLRNGVRDENSA